MTIRIGFPGATGRISQLCQEASAAAGFLISGGTVRANSTRTPPQGIEILPDVRALADVSDVIVDFTHADTVEAHADALKGTSCAWVLGTSGVTPTGKAAIERIAKEVPVFYAANFSRGMNVVLLLAERLAQALPAESYDAEIVDIFHRNKVDAPSGTAIALGEAVARGRGRNLADVMVAGREGDIGARKPDEIGFSSLRGGSVAGENQLIITGPADQTSLAHRVSNPRVYAKGALQAAQWVVGKPAGLYSMKDMLLELNR